MILKKLRSFLWTIVLGASGVWAQQAAETAGAEAAHLREWTNAEGKKITAEYLGIRDQSVFLKLADGRIMPILLDKLSANDHSFISRNPMEYREVWQAWPASVDLPMANTDVRGTAGEGGKIVYSTRHFRFCSDVNLGTTLMKDIARVFELTYELHAKSPFGILATPVDRFYQAELFGTRKQYMEAGGIVNTAGIYRPKDRKFLAPLELMGVESGTSGWRKISKGEYDPTAIVHELTHMLTHDMLDNLPAWFNEGYAEYMANIPIDRDSVRTSGEKIKQGARGILMKEYEDDAGRPLTSADIGYANPGGGKKPAPDNDRVKKSDMKKMSFKLLPVAKMLTMTDADWMRLPQQANGPGILFPGQQRRPANYQQMKLMQQRYRTAHLIVYYFIQIEGEKGVAKIRGFLDENRNYLAQYREYEEKFRIYQVSMEQFMRLPGVKDLHNGRIEYPASLKPPVAPEAPFTDPNLVKLGGLKVLLGGDSAATVGKRIERALQENLGLVIQFADM